MSAVLEYLHQFNFATICARLVLAVLAGGIIGQERGKHGSAAGLRTHILVCVGAAMTALTGIYINHLTGSGDVMRLAAQVISGIGFLGAGMIIVKNGNTVTGLTTAAGMWATAAIGIALGYGFYSGAAVATVACVFTAAFLTRLERRRKKSSHLYLELSADKNINFIVDKIRNEIDSEALIEVVQPKSNLSDSIGMHLTISNRKYNSDVRDVLNGMEGVRFTIGY